MTLRGGDPRPAPRLAASWSACRLISSLLWVVPPPVAAKHATTTILLSSLVPPIPSRRGLVTSLGRPGGNITGAAVDGGPEIAAKRLELLKEAVPTISSVAILLGQARQPTYDAVEQAQESTARC